MSENRLVRLRRRLNPLFDDVVPQTPGVRLFNMSLAALIVINVATVLLDSVQSLHERDGVLFWRIEQVATAVFALEYVLRVWGAVDLQGGQYAHPLWGRLRYMRSFFAIVDLAAVLPAVLGLLGASGLRVLRLIRLLRMLKLTRHSSVFGLLWAVIREEARSIAAILFIICLLLLISSSLMYMLEYDAQPDVFSSIPASLWWAVETVTTIGYGDMVPRTALGKVLGGLLSFLGVGTLALYSGLITVSFMDQLRLRRDRLRHEVEVHLAAGHLGPAEVRSIERLGDRLGLPSELTEEAVEEAIAEEAGVLLCPHCGTPIKHRQPSRGDA